MAPRARLDMSRWQMRWAPFWWRCPGRLMMAMVDALKWVYLKMGYTPNYSHLVGIMIINHNIPQWNSHLVGIMIINHNIPQLNSHLVGIMIINHNIPQWNSHLVGIMIINHNIPQWNSHLVGIMISKTIGFFGLHYFQTNPNVNGWCWNGDLASGKRWQFTELYGKPPFLAG